MILPASELAFFNGHFSSFGSVDTDRDDNDDIDGSEDPEDDRKSRDFPVTHSPAEAPLCAQCRQTEAAYFDLSCLKCLQLLVRPQTDISQIFAVMRQWNPHTQRSIKFCIQQILEKGGHVNDRDSVSDMTLLHFACKAGAAGIGDPQVAAEVVQDLISRGADVFARCKWTQMTPLHYAALFDAAPIIQILVGASHALDIDGPCNDYENGGALHIAAANLALNAAVALVEAGANTKIKDNLGRTALDCIPDRERYQHMPHTEELIDQLQQVLSRDTKVRRSPPPNNLTKPAAESVAGRAMLKTMALNIGDRILVDKAKPATLRYCGTVDFASGVWVGVELDTADGKNDGVIQDTVYFKCSPNHGLFVPLNRVSKFPSASSMKSSLASSGYLRYSPPRQSPKTSAPSTPTNSGSIKPDQLGSQELHVGDLVMVTTLGGAKHRGRIRFCGETRFAGGVWFGIELDKPNGRNDGSVQGVQYFQCPARHGIFATSSKLKKMHEDPVEKPKAAAAGLSRRSSSSASTKPTQAVTLRRSLSARHRESGTQPTQTFAPTSLPTIKQKPTSRADENRPEWQSTATVETTKIVKKKANQHWLDLGMNVLFNHQVGVIKYIGRVGFADGVWLGLEMRDHVGRHDGQVQGRRYFNCRASRGLMVRPSSVTVRGINGATLIKPE